MTPAAAAYPKSSHLDHFTLDNLPPAEWWPDQSAEPAEFRFPPRLNCVADLLEPAVAAHGDRTAILAPGGFEWSFRELDAAVARIAHVLTDDLGLVAGNRVLVRGVNSPAAAAIWLAVVKAGGVVVPTMPLLRAKELRYIIDKARITHVLCETGLEHELRAALTSTSAAPVVLGYDAPLGGDLAAAMAGKPATFETVDTWSEDPCLIAFTSGTTGPAKGTVHMHRDIAAICAGFPRSVLRATPEDRFIGTPPLAFTFGLGGLLLFPLVAGSATILLDRPSPAALAEAIGEYGATVCFTAPTAYRRMALDSTAPLHSLRTCVSAGEPLPTATRNLWRERTGLHITDGPQ